MPGNEQSRPVECCCQDSIPINDAERNISDQQSQPKMYESMINRKQSDYMQQSEVNFSTVDTINSNKEIPKYESSVINETEEEVEKETEKQAKPQQLETMEIQFNQAIESEGAKDQPEKVIDHLEEANSQLEAEDLDEKTMLAEDIEYFSIVDKYKKIIKEANLLQDLESKIAQIKKPIEDAIVLQNVTYNKEKDLKFKVTIKEHILETVRHHELVQEFQIRDIDPE